MEKKQKTHDLSFIGARIIQTEERISPQLEHAEYLIVRHCSFATEVWSLSCTQIGRKWNKWKSRLRRWNNSK